MRKKILLFSIIFLASLMTAPVFASSNKDIAEEFPRSIDSDGRKTIVVSPRLHAWAAYDEEGMFIRSGRASLGKDYCPDLGKSCRTPSGKYIIYEKRGSGCISSKFPIPYGGAPMAYCMFFHEGYALHASDNVPAGYNASHGCVRLLHADARWLNLNFIDMPEVIKRPQYPGTNVIIKPY